MANTKLAVEDRIVALTEAMELLGEVEDLVRSVGDTSLNAYVADHINAQDEMMGEQMFQTIEKVRNELSLKEVQNIRLLKTVKNEKYGIQTEITAYYKGGFTVGLRDLDSGIRLPEAKVFPEWADAVNAAESWAAGNELEADVLEAKEVE